MQRRDGDLKALAFSYFGHDFYGGQGNMTVAREIMRTDIICVQPETPVILAGKIMKDARVGSLVVLDYDHSVVGMLSQADLMKLFTQKNRGEEDFLVVDIMTEGVITADENDDIGEITSSLIKNHFRQLPVVSNGKCVGVISRGELLRDAFGLN